LQTLDSQGVAYAQFETTTGLVWLPLYSESTMVSLSETRRRDDAGHPTWKFTRLRPVSNTSDTPLLPLAAILGIVAGSIFLIVVVVLIVVVMRQQQKKNEAMNKQPPGGVRSRMKPIQWKM
jgi:hypothetical protein